ncbi:hypothetical protein [Streptomyces sp. NBC_01006]|uniref:hypothetical protein n=1 Tax=Streptomyces sp. NBC_01006 TaxID=2903716 RepID=UPI00386FFEB6|nr:hypothetical protein OG509_35005 [Streptomyces sp. NBC_01006]
MNGRRVLTALVMALLTVAFCTAAGSPAHVHALSRAEASAFVVADPPGTAELSHPDDPAAPHQPGDHCSRERTEPYWTGAEGPSPTGRATLVEADPAQPRDPSGPHLDMGGGPPGPACTNTQSCLCLWRI